MTPRELTALLIAAAQSRATIACPRLQHCGRCYRLHPRTFVYEGRERPWHEDTQDRESERARRVGEKLRMRRVAA